MTNEPIMKILNFARKMEPFVERARLTGKHYDVGDVTAINVVERCRKGMNQILLRQKLSELEAKWAIRETFSIAVTYKLETRRRQQRVLKQKAQEIQILKLLDKIKVIRNTVSSLEQKARSKLNEITVKQCWEDFDTEAFAGIVHAMVDMLPTLSPTRIANDARSAICETTLPEYYTPEVRNITRCGGPAVLELWETIPAITRVQTEQFMRRLPQGTSVVRFLRHLEDGLAIFMPRSKNGRSHAIVSVFAYRVAKIWIRLGLHVGRAYDGEENKERDSPFQSFCRHALAAVGESCGISRRQVCKLQHCLSKPNRLKSLNNCEQFSS